MENAPETLQQIYNVDKKCRHSCTIMASAFLFISQVFKLVYFGCIAANLQKGRHKAIETTDLFEIVSIAALLGAFLSEFFYWVTIYGTVRSQAQQ